MDKPMTLQDATRIVSAACVTNEKAWGAWLLIHAHLAREVRVTDEDVQRAVNAAWKCKDFGDKPQHDIARAILESFAQTLGEPVAVPDAIDIDCVPSWVMKLSDPPTYVAGWNACREAMIAQGQMQPFIDDVDDDGPGVKKALEAHRQYLAQGNSGVRDGWKLVPVEPNDAMAVAACKASLDRPGTINGVLQYRAMLAAAPSPDDVEVK